MALIHETVASYYNINKEDLCSTKRPREIAFPRQIAMYLCRELTNNSLLQIAQSFNKNDHSTVIHAHKKISDKIKEDAKLNKSITELTERIKNL